MIIILEGMEGSGKSTLAGALSGRTGLPVYRPFRSAPGEHWDQDASLGRDLREIGVQPNTYIEDLYVADVLTGTRANVILDRSMPSGYAYGLRDNVASKSVLDKALGYWLWRLSARSDVTYIHLAVDRAVARKRVADRDGVFDADRWKAIESSLEDCYKKASKRFQSMVLRPGVSIGVLLDEAMAGIAQSRK